VTGLQVAIEQQPDVIVVDLGGVCEYAHYCVYRLAGRNGPPYGRNIWL
jgi:hypothetical protein